jgi:hypothetical protein
MPLIALALHPLCRKLAISQVANGCLFKIMVEAALDVAKQWRWDEQVAKLLVGDLKEYYKCKTYPLFPEYEGSTKLPSLK